MATVNRWAIIENNQVVNVILADEEFIAAQGFNAIQDDLATVGLSVDENGNIVHPDVTLVQAELPEEATND